MGIHATTEQINGEIQKSIKYTDGETLKPVCDTNDISDGYHTFGELYKHRIHLYIALCRNYDTCCPIGERCFKSKIHHDGTSWDGWFLLQLETNEGQISYHLPNKYWDKCGFAETLDKANKWDGHTADDVLERLLKI